MKHIVKTFSLLSIIAVIPGAMAATSRVSMISRVSPRLPSIAAYIAANSASKTTTTSTTSYMSDPDCLANYTDCIKGADACGSDFSECPTNIALHTKMPNCLSVLSQCSTSGVTSLFGTSSWAAITTATTNDDGDITGYTYPTADSALGQMVTASALTNRLSKDQCVKKYSTCLHKDSVCGDDFELCTTDSEFKKQALSCDSVLGRCQGDGKTELFGSVTNATSLKPAAGSRIGEMISTGAQLAAVNAVSTCYKVADQCILNACAKNPTRCLEGRNKKQVKIGDNIADGTATTTGTQETTVDLTTAADVKKFIKGACLDTIGTNKYCYATVAAENTGSNLKFSSEKIKSYTHLSEDEIEEVFEDLYDTRMRDSLKKSIQDLADKFDAKAKDSCVDTISTCAMRSCGGGIGSVCYTQSKSGEGIDIRNNKSYKEIQSACGAIVNTDSNCQYAASSDDSVFMYTYIDDSTFSKLFPQDTASDPIGVAASLNSLLATSYNEVAIADMKKQCRTVALSCVKSMCGKDYVNCYRNRTDIVAGTSKTGNDTFDKSMNKVGGVLDYSIVIGLCLDTVQNTPVCEEHLKIAISEDSSLANLAANTWGDATSVRSAWKDANALQDVSSNYSKVLVACRASDDTLVKYAESDDEDYDCTGTLPPLNGKCVGVMDGKCVYDTPVYMGETEYVMKSAAETLFQELLADVEVSVQQLYNSKLTKEQNMCNASNAGGIKGANNNGSTFMWVKLNSNKIPKNYNMQGLSTKQFKETGDLYGGFCRARITVTSDDRAIQEKLGNKATAYFAVGDAFTCGSWIDNNTLKDITDEVAAKARKDAGEGSVKETIAYTWATVAGLLGGGAVGTALTESGVLGKWLNSADIKNAVTSTTENNKKACVRYTELVTGTIGENDEETVAIAKAKSALNSLKSAQTLCEQVVPENAKKAYCGIPSITNPTDKETAIEALSSAKTAAASIKTSCEQADNDFTPGNKAARIAVPIVTSVAGGALGAGITASVLKAKYEDAANEAVKQWMEEIGEHIQCYLGAEELGTYGDVITIEIE